MQMSLLNNGVTSEKVLPEDETASVRLLTRGWVGLALLLTIFATFVVITRYVCLPFFIYLYPETTSFILDTGIYGAYPRQDESCASGLVLLDVSGQSVPEDGPMITDMSGNLIWSAAGQYGPATADTKIQRYNDEDFLTFWAGDKLQESGLGKYYMLNSSYDLVHTVSAVGEGLQGDLQEFKITGDGSAPITVYKRIQTDLGSRNVQQPTNRMIVDGIFQEVNIATGKLLFQWRASEHLDHPALQQSDDGLVADGSLDYFHVNSIDKDSQGNYLVSLRLLHTLVYVERETGQILWTLGADAGDFGDISMGAATSFRWQHDARWISEDEGIMSLFDNGNAHKHQDSPHSQGLIIQLDFVDKTATLLQSYTSRDSITSPSQGNVHMLQQPEGDEHVFIGWGASAPFTEHSLNGDSLCETHFGASWLFYFEGVKSYRAFKTFEWKGKPAAWGPAAQTKDGRIHVSSNGATEVTYWSLQQRSRALDLDSPKAISFDDVDTVIKGSAFESSLRLPSDDRAGIYRIVALDTEQTGMRFSNEVVYEHTPIIWWVCLALFAVVSS